MRRRTIGLLAIIAVVAAACSDDESQGGASPSVGDATTASTQAAATTEPVAAPPTTTSTCDAPSRAASTTSESLDHDGIERTYRLSIPPGYDGTTPAPLLVNLHGFTGTGEEQNAGTGMVDAAGARGYIVVAPDGGPLILGAQDSPEAAEAAELGFEGVRFWNVWAGGAVSFGDGPAFSQDAGEIGADDTGFLTELIAHLSAELCVDGQRIYATGMSNGAGMSTTLGCELGDVLAAIAPVAGVNLTATCPGDEPMPVLAVHGDEDTAVHFEGNYLLGFTLGNPSVPERMSQWAQRNGCVADHVVDAPVAGVERWTWPECAPGATTELWVIAGGDHIWPNGAAGDPTSPIEATPLVLEFFDQHTRAAA